MMSAGFPSEADILNMPPPKLRFQQALYFYERFKECCGSPTTQLTSWFHWLAYADAFLMALISLQDMVSPARRKKLLKPGSATHPNAFLVLKLLRNRTIHACVFAAPRQKRKDTPGSVSRIINVHRVLWVEPTIGVANLETMLSRIMGKYYRTRKHDPRFDVRDARHYLKMIKARGEDQIRFQGLFQEGIDFVRDKCKV
jgi:hypothetical protein